MAGMAMSWSICPSPGAKRHGMALGGGVMVQGHCGDHFLAKPRLFLIVCYVCWSVHAKCLMKWPQEENFENFENCKGHCVGVALGYLWVARFSNWQRFGWFAFSEDLVFVCISKL